MVGTGGRGNRPPESKEKTPPEANGDPVASVLDLIQSQVATTRFSQGWDPDQRRLSFGCGDSTRGVLVRSDRTSTVANAGFFQTRFSKEIARAFLERRLPCPQGDQLHETLKLFLRDHVHFPDDRLYTLVALWITGTYLYSIFGHYGYLYLHSRRKRSGKTRTLELLRHVTFQASGPLNAPTPAALREMAAEGGTLLLDTLERWREKSCESYSAAMDLLDAGFRSGGAVVKMVSPSKGQWSKAEFPVYAPYAMAAINRESLTDTARDRSFVIEMRRKPTKLRKQNYNFHQCEKRCRPVRWDLYAWALANAQAVAAAYESNALGTEVATLGLNDRAADIWRPIFAISRVIGLEVREVDHLRALARKMSIDSEVAEEEHTLEALRGLQQIVSDGKITGMTTELQEQLRALGVDTTDLHAVLTGCGFEQGSIRLEEGPRRAWELTNTQLDEAVAELTGREGVSTVSESDREGRVPREPVSLPEGDYGDYKVQPGGRER